MGAVLRSWATYLPHRLNGGVRKQFTALRTKRRRRPPTDDDVQFGRSTLQRWFYRPAERRRGRWRSCVIAGSLVATMRICRPRAPVQNRLRDVGARSSSSRGIERASANCYCVRHLCDAPAIGSSSRSPGMFPAPRSSFRRLRRYAGLPTSETGGHSRLAVSRYPS